jgi:hypothetical protein
MIQPLINRQKDSGTNGNVMNAQSYSTQNVVITTQADEATKEVAQHLSLIHDIQSALPAIKSTYQNISNIVELTKYFNQINHLISKEQEIALLSSLSEQIQSLANNNQAILTLAQNITIITQLSPEISKLNYLYDIRDSIENLVFIKDKLNDLYNNITSLNDLARNLSFIKVLSDHLLAIEVIAQYVDTLEYFKDNKRVFDHLDQLKEDLHVFTENIDKIELAINVYKDLPNMVDKVVAEINAKSNQYTLAIDQIKKDVETFKQTVNQTIASSITKIEKLMEKGIIKDDETSNVTTFSSSKITKDFRSKDDSYSKTEVNNALAAKLDKSAQAADSAKLGGKIPAAYCLAEDYYNRNAINTILSNKLDKSLKGVASGLASLDSAGKIPSSQLPSYVDDVLEFATRAAFPATGESGKIYIDMATNRTYRWSGSTYVKIASGEVESINSKTGVVILTKADLALGNVDNTSDANKPVSTATQQALDGKLDKTETAANSSQLDGKASSEYYQRNHANTSKITSVAGTSIDLSQGDNFLLDMNVKATLVLNNPQVGQVGIIRVTNATNITGYDAKIKFRNVPSSLTANETFSYFVLDSENIIMGRA